MRFIVLLLIILPRLVEGQLYSTYQGDVRFESFAPLEIITAHSSEMQGIIDLTKKKFVFKMFIKSFDGFNSPLQKEHFLENYLEVDVFPIATFKGKIIEKIDVKKKEYRAKGTLTIHGVKKEVIIPVSINIKDDEVVYKANFSLALSDFGISIPPLVKQKISENIVVNVSGAMQQRRQ